MVALGRCHTAYLAVRADLTLWISTLLQPWAKDTRLSPSYSRILILPLVFSRRFQEMVPSRITLHPLLRTYCHKHRMPNTLRRRFLRFTILTARLRNHSIRATRPRTVVPCRPESLPLAILDQAYRQLRGGKRPWLVCLATKRPLASSCTPTSKRPRRKEK